MEQTTSLSPAAVEDLARRGFTRRQMLRVAALVGAGTALPFGSERALAQLSNVGALPDDAVKINANEFPEGPSPRALAALVEVAKRGNRYQYPETDALVAAAAKLEGLKPEHFSVYPGSSLALHHAVIAFTGPKQALVTAEPGYEAAARAAEFVGAKVIRVPLRADGAHDLPAMLAAAQAQPVGLFYVCNPNNPTGTGRLAGAARRGVHPLLRRAARGRPRARGQGRRAAAHVLQDLRHGRAARGLRDRPARAARAHDRLEHRGAAGHRHGS
jgi:DNA-binding transcriptional MocR family regulator